MDDECDELLSPLGETVGVTMAVTMTVEVTDWPAASVVLGANVSMSAFV